MSQKKNLSNHLWFYPAAFLAVFLMISILMTVIYSVLDVPGGNVMTSGGFFSETGTPGKACLNGYLGTLFKFRYLGNINWLLLPLAVWFFSNRQRWEPRWLALTFVLSGLFLLIAIKGYFSTRYQLTLFPFSTVLSLIILLRFLEGKPRWLKPASLGVLVLLCLFNFYHYRDLWTFYLKTSFTLETPHFPHRLTAWLNHPSRISLDTDHRTLVINRPIFYYYSQRKGIDYKRQDAWQVMRLFGEKSGLHGRRIYDILRKQLAVSFLLLKDSERQFYGRGQLEEFLNCQCNLIIRDNGWMLYRLREKPLEDIFRDDLRFEKISVWNPQRRRPSVISPEMGAWLTRGTFDFSAGVETDERSPVERRIIEVRNVTPDTKGERLFNFGYEFNRNGLNFPVPAGRYVHFHVRAAIDAELLKSPSQIFISDFDGKSWESTVMKFTTPGRRSYLVSRKLRSNSQRVLIGFRFTPQNSRQRLSFRDPEIRISNEPL